MSASAVLKLQKVGFTIDQVEALADFMDTQAASKADLAEAKSELKADLAEVKSELKADIAEVRTELEAVTHRLDLVEANLRGQIIQVEQRMTIKLGGMLVLITGILLTAIRYLPTH